MKSQNLIILFLFIISCQQPENQISTIEFNRLMANVADGWSSQNTDKALSSFSEEAIYMEPPNIQYYRGHRELKLYFNALDERHAMNFHHLWFNESTQSGAGEYTFSYGTDTSDVGIVAVEIDNEKIVFWREYQRKGPTNFKEFLGIEDKNWEWHIGNYPEPKDTITAQ